MNLTASDVMNGDVFIFRSDISVREAFRIIANKTSAVHRWLTMMMNLSES